MTHGLMTVRLANMTLKYTVTPTVLSVVPLSIPNPAMLTFCIAGLGFGMEVPHDITVTENFAPFLSSDGKIDIRLRYHACESLPKVMGDCVYRNILFEVYCEGDAFTRVYIDHLRGDRPYAVSGLIRHPAGKKFHFSWVNGAFFRDAQLFFTYRL